MMRATATRNRTKGLFSWLVCATGVLGVLSGCTLFDDLEDDGGVVDVFTAHHGTPTEQGELPDHGQAGMARYFQTDLGWEISLGEAYITTAGVDLANCDGGIKPVDLFWGPSAESVVDTPDAEPRGIGGVRSEPAKFCQLRIRYGPYSFGEGQSDGAQHKPPRTDTMEGQTILLRGSAQKDGQAVEFEFVSDMRLDVVRDISTLRDGKPLQVRRDQSFPEKIVLTKTYDRFFDGIDFNDYTQADIEAAATAALDLDSDVIYDVNVQAGIE